MLRRLEELQDLGARRVGIHTRERASKAWRSAPIRSPGGRLHWHIYPYSHLRNQYHCCWAVPLPKGVDCVTDIPNICCLSAHAYSLHIHSPISLQPTMLFCAVRRPDALHAAQICSFIRSPCIHDRQLRERLFSTPKPISPIKAECMHQYFGGSHRGSSAELVRERYAVHAIPTVETKG